MLDFRKPIFIGSLPLCLLSIPEDLMMQVFLKINSDDTFSPNNLVGLDVVIRDEDKVVLLSDKQRVDASWSPAVAEARVILYGMLLAVDASVLPTLVKFDSACVINLITIRSLVRSEIGLILDDIFNLSDSYAFNSFIFSLNNSNKVIHSLVKLALVDIDEIVLMGEVPSGLFRLDQEDFIST
ncbi:hypothetical protein ACOSQ4_031315 [Xanthoceras sorbifolium]